VVDGDEWSTSLSGRFTSGETPRGWVGPGAGLDAVAKRNNRCPSRESNFGRPDPTSRWSKITKKQISQVLCNIP